MIIDRRQAVCVRSVAPLSGRVHAFSFTGTRVLLETIAMVVAK
jgi:hypothetical protein